MFGAIMSGRERAAAKETMPLIPHQPNTKRIFQEGTKEKKCKCPMLTNEEKKKGANTIMNYHSK